MALPLQHLGLVGYGEVGRIFSAGLCGHFSSAAAWDLKFADPATGAAAQATAAGVQAMPSMAALCTHSDFILSAVTASTGETIETIAKADASTAWCLSQAGGCAMSAAYLDLPVARAIFGDRAANVYALDAETGALLWQQVADPHQCALLAKE